MEANAILLKYIYAKNNELESLKKFADEDLLKIIEAKQDTLLDMENLVKHEIDQHILSL